MNTSPKPEFSLEVAVRDVPNDGLEIVFEAKPAEREALARRFDLVGLDLLRGEAVLRPWRKVGLTLHGRFEARLVQKCVVTLEPVESRIEESFTLRFLPAEMLEEQADAPGSEREIIIDAESEEPPEAIENGRVDVGEAIAEQLALAIDPYPRKPDIAFEAAAALAGEEAQARENPFAALEKLKKKD